MKQKKYIVLIIIIIAIIVLGCIFIIIPKNRKNNSIEQSSNESIVQNNPHQLIKEGNIEVKRIDVSQTGSEVEITTTLLNDSNEDMDGLFISIGLYDESGNQITTYSSDEQNKIPAKGTYTLKNYATISEEVNVSDAKILLLEGNTRKALENVFDTVENIE